jgi:HD-GYP domain-containing protein (c-di-GMP phosphodiesterase class II)
MFSATQEIIASSLMDNKQHNPEKKILTLKDLPSLKYQQIFNELMNGKQTGEINDNGKEYIYFLTKLPQLTGKDWYIASVIEKELIVADIKITMMKTVLIGLLIMIVTYFPIQYLLKKYVIEPIHRLEYMTNEIAHNRFENIKDIKTVIYEFYELSNSIMSMSQSIQKYELDQKNLIDSFIKILAESIDAKSPYTGGHCERVPEIAKMLVKEASDCKEGIFKDFNLTTEDEIREFEIAAWLHDCGKVVTPEYVVDKATKLETIYNRIHEIRTRFEVLHRDATIEYNVQLIKDASQKEALQKQLDEQHKKLQEDFEFLAECNIGGEFMDDTKIERLKEIANLTWVRNFNDRIGLSQAELLRVGNTPTTTPQIEKLLSDKPEHVINREKDIDEADYKQYKFKVDIPNYAYNMGELYNMCIKRGTLTEEERFKINEHIIMTIKMLEQLPFTSNLQKVPEYAGSHHETMIGSGYPRKLSKEEISIPARIMAIADIFEALTASDRPYKKAKTLSESIKIMSFMAKDGHIDSDLFKLFLTSGNYLTYANTYLKPEQIDEVDITQYI